MSFLKSQEFVIFSTRNFADEYNLSIKSASERLKRYHSSNLITKITRGIWCNTSHPDFSPLGAVPFILGKEHGYISFLSALHLHGMLSQIPKQIQVATTGHARILQTPIGIYKFFQLNTNMMLDGVVLSETNCEFRIASPEKALLDTFFLSARKGNKFKYLPEIELEDSFDKKVFLSLLRNQVNNQITREAIGIKFERLCNLQSSI